MTETESDSDGNLPAIILPEVQLAKSKAEQAKWEAVKKGLELTEEAGRFIGKVVGPAAEAVGGILGDQCRYWRTTNVNRLAAKMAANAAERQIDLEVAKALPFGDAVRVLDAATMEDDENVLNLWAKLLVGAMDPSGNIVIKKPYIDLLRSFGAPEAVLMEFMWRCYSRLEKARMIEMREVEAELLQTREAGWGKFPRSDQQTAIQNLVRLRCVAYRPRAPKNVKLFRQVRDSLTVRTEVNPDAFKDLIAYLENTAFELAGVKPAPERSSIPIGNFSGQTIKIPELNLLFTALGSELMRSCHPTKSPENK